METEFRRIQRKRTKGWRAPDGTINVGRPSKWGNPYPNAEQFEAALHRGELSYTVGDVRRELQGQTLMCWCAIGSPCHGDVLFRIANT